MNLKNNQEPKVTIRRVTVLNNVLVALLVVILIAVLAWVANLYISPSRNNSETLAGKFNLQRTAIENSDQAAIENLLQKTCNFEFQVYKGAEGLDTTGMSDYFVAGSPAYKKVWQNISGVNERNWSLNNESNASYCAMLEIDVVNSNGEVAEVVTRENWYLDYVIAGTSKSVYTYSQLNSQYYQLRKTPDGWKIYLNHYPSINIVFDD